MRARSLIPFVLPATLLGLAACGGDEKPPPKVAHESAGTQVKRVATRWSDTVEDTGFLDRDPNGVLEFHVLTTRTLTLGEGASARLRVERDETFKTKVGNFRCKARGELAGTVTYAWDAGDPVLRVELPAADLPRACEQGGFPVQAKALPASTMRLVLKSDRLLGRASARDRTVLLPLP